MADDLGSTPAPPLPPARALWAGLLLRTLCFSVTFRLQCCSLAALLTKPRISGSVLWVLSGLGNLHGAEIEVWKH